MSRRSKLDRFSDNKDSWNVLEQGKPLFESIKGNWNDFFQNENPIVIELACGRGEYSVAMAERFADKNFIGIDIKGDRIWKGSQHALVNHISNLAFLRTNIFYLCDFFEENEVSEIWLTFPDPRPKDRDEKHRLTNKTYLKKYQHILRQDGWFKFKTDNTALFEYTLQVIIDYPIQDHSFTTDLYQSEFIDEHYGIQTKYERIWTSKGEKIKYMKFRFADKASIAN